VTWRAVSISPCTADWRVDSCLSVTEPRAFFRRVDAELRLRAAAAGREARLGEGAEAAADAGAAAEVGHAI